MKIKKSSMFLKSSSILGEDVFVVFVEFMETIYTNGVV